MFTQAFWGPIPDRNGAAEVHATIMPSFQPTKLREMLCFARGLWSQPRADSILDSSFAAL